MVVHSVGIAMGVSSALAVGEVVVRTTNELPSALAQHEKNVVIENEELNRKFSRLAYWQEARWWFVAFLVYKLLASSIANDYRGPRSIA
jgi:hypothetical protein